METVEGLKPLYAKSRADWRQWLDLHSESEKKTWLVIYHKSSSTPSVRFQEAIEEAICFGWVDSKAKKRGPDSCYLSFHKRNPKSTWGKKSKERAARMIREGLMTERGQAMIDLARKTGTWDANHQAYSKVIPPDLQKNPSKK